MIRIWLTRSIYWYSVIGSPKSKLFSIIYVTIKNLHYYITLCYFFPCIINFCLCKLSNFYRYLILARNSAECRPSSVEQSERDVHISGVPNSVTRNRRKIAAVPSGKETISPLEMVRHDWGSAKCTAMPNWKRAAKWNANTMRDRNAMSWPAPQTPIKANNPRGR